MARHFLLESGIVAPADLQQALRDRDARGGTLAQHLASLGAVDEGKLARALSERYRVPLLSVAEMEQIPPAVSSLLTPELAIEHRAVPVRLEGDQVVVVMSDPGDEHAIEEVTFFASMYIQRAVTLESGIDWALGHYYALASSSPADEEISELFANKSEPSQLYVLDRPKAKRSRQPHQPRKTLPEEASGRPTFPEGPSEGHDTEEHPTVPAGHQTTPASVPVGPQERDAAPTIRMPALFDDSVPAPELEVELLEGTADDQRPTLETRAAPADGDLADSSTGEMPTLPHLADVHFPTDGEQEPAELRRRPRRRRRDSDDLDIRPTTVFETVKPRGEATTETPPSTLEAEPAEGKDDNGAADSVTVGREHFTARHGTITRTRRDTLTGLAPATAETPATAAHKNSGSSGHHRFPRLTEAEAPAVTDLKAALSSAHRAIRESRTADEIADAALAYLGLICERRALLRVIDGSELHGWAAAGGSLTTETFKQLRQPIAGSSVFGAVVQSTMPYQGPLLYDRDERVFASHIGKHPEQIILLPVLNDEEVVALVYGDGLTATHSLPFLREMARELADAIARLPPE